MANNRSTFEVPFGILNKKGTIEIQDRTCINPIFAHETYPITCTFDNKYNTFYKKPEENQINLEDNNRKFGKLYYLLKDSEEAKVFEGQSYQKLYRKSVKWNFGDGTEIDGYSATHTYKTPGKYTITCTFFDINRKGLVNGFSLDVIVKQVIPTELKFDPDGTEKEAIHCSAIERIARIETLLSNNVKNDVSVIAKRIYQKDEPKDDTWDDVKDLPFPHLRKYYCFIESQKVYYYNTRRLYDEKMFPVTKYTPDYETIYGNFEVEENKLIFKPYRVQPYKQVEPMNRLEMIDPNSNIYEKESYIEYDVQDVSSIEELPEGYLPVGKRGWVDIYYRSDFLSDAHTFSFFYDLDEINLHNSIESSSNFLNIPPLGLSVGIHKNDPDDIIFMVTLNGFPSYPFDYIDKLVKLSLIKNYNFPSILIPIVRNTDRHFITEITEEAILQENAIYTYDEYNTHSWMTQRYFIPKDFDFLSLPINISYGNNNDSKLTIEEYNNLPYIKALLFDLKNILDATITIDRSNIIFDYPLYDLDKVIIPKEKYHKEDIDKLLKVYTPHTMFDDTNNFKGMLSNLFKTRDFLNYVITKGKNFFDDNVNVKTNYVENLLQTLTMMGQDISEYSTTNFEGVNDLRDLTRILSINHSELVGNNIDESFNINTFNNSKGKHVGERILVTDKLYVLMDNLYVGDKRFYKGKITAIERDGKLLKTVEPVALIASDDYAHESRILSFSDIEPSEITENGEGIYYIKDYVENWGWNLLLPEKYKLEDKAKIIDSYYSFYLLVPPQEKVYIGNFVDETTITEEITDPEKWIEEDGITFRMVQKVVHPKI